MMVLTIGVDYFENFPIHLSTLLDLAEEISIAWYGPAVTSFVGSNAGLYTEMPSPLRSAETISEILLKIKPQHLTSQNSQN